MREEMTLEFGLLREGFIGTMAAFPTAVVPISLCSINSAHMGSDEMLLESTGVGKGSTTYCFDSVDRRCPLADMQLVVLGEVRGRENR